MMGGTNQSFQFLDSIVREEEKNLVGIKNVSLNEDFFVGHFPDQPVMPGVLIVESLAQAGQALIGKRTKSDGVPALIGTEKMRFRKPVVPGDQLILEVELLEWDGKTGKIRGEARVGDEVAASGELTLALEEKVKEAKSWPP